MLVPVIIIYIMCMPMGYVVGKNFVERKARRWEHTIDQEKERQNYSFVPIATSLVLPMAAVLAIFEIMDGV